MTTTETTAPAQPELRVTITIPLHADPFMQADMLSACAPHIDRAQNELQALGFGGVQVERRVVKPKPPKRAAAPVLAALLAVLLLPACGTPGGDGADCLTHAAPVCIPSASDDDLAAGSF
jgi:hypothetical protein